MPYPAALLESLARVEASRSRRLNETFPRLSPQERETILRAFHPDYIADAFRELRLGPNTGDRAPRELAAVLEAPPIVGPDFSLPDSEDSTCDVLVIGGGGAGASAALLAQAGGADVLLTTKLRFGDANTMMAQGGIQAADKANDSPAIHYLDVMGGGGFSNDPDLVEALVTDAPGAIAWLESLGAMFDKEPDGTLRTIHGGGTSRKRMHAARDYTGAEIMRTLRDEVRSRSDGSRSDGLSRPIRLWEFRPAIELLLDDKGQAVGAVIKDLDTGQWLIVRAKAVVIATGGSGRLHYQGFPTTNHYGATGDGLVLAYRAGARLAFIDTMQYHPTGAAFPEQILGQLVTEKVRGLGAQVCNVAGEQFVYPHGRTDVPGLFVAGEAAGGIHGRNRLMGNSLLDICVFGRRAGTAAAEWAQCVEAGAPALAHLEKWVRARRESGLAAPVSPIQVAGSQPSPLLLPDYTRRRAS